MNHVDTRAAPCMEDEIKMHKFGYLFSRTSKRRTCLATLIESVARLTYHILLLLYQLLQFLPNRYEIEKSP